MPLNTIPVQFDKVSGKLVLTTNGLSSSTISGIQFIQGLQSTVWVIEHNRDTTACLVQAYVNNKMVIPTDIEIIDNNTIHVTFSGSPQQGYANIIFLE